VSFVTFVTREVYLSRLGAESVLSPLFVAFINS